MGLSLAILLVGSVCVFLPGLLSGLLAWNKGYRLWFWLFSMGPVGTIVMALMPGLSVARNPEELERMESRADWIGGILSGFTALVVFGVPLIGMTLLRFSAMSAPPPPPSLRMAPAPAPAVVPDSSRVSTPAK